jgi:hypothetical protein
MVASGAGGYDESEGKIVTRVRTILVSLVVVTAFGLLAPACGGGGCGSKPPEPPPAPSTP